MSSLRQYSNKLKRNFLLYAVGFGLFTVLMGLLESMGVFRSWIGLGFLFSSVAIYAVIGWFCKTNDPEDFYVSGRKVPAIFNGLATSADWMSAASFIGMAGGIYLQGFDYHAFIMGWTGGYVLVALLIAPYFRQYGHYTIPDYIGGRYGGHAARSIAIFATILVSFVYIIAQIYGTGLIATRLMGSSFAVGVMIALGGILACSFMGGMKAVTWTQVAQGIVLILTYLIPPTMLAYKHTGVPIPQLMYGPVLEKLTEREKILTTDEKEKSAREAMKSLAEKAKAKLKEMEKDSVKVHSTDKAVLETNLAKLKAVPEDLLDDAAVDRAAAALAAFPADPVAYKARLEGESKLGARAVPPRPHAKPYPGNDDDARFKAKLNFLTLAIVLMLGTAALPHILVRFQTTPSIKETRESVGWSLFFIFLVYFTAPAVAVLVKYDIYSVLVGSKFDDLPFWVTAWSRVDSTLLSVVDYNKDGIIQLAEVAIGGDLVVLISPELAGMPYVISALIAAGGFAAAVSTADGLLMAVASSLSHDTYFRMVKPTATPNQRAVVAKGALVLTATVAAAVTLTKPGQILFLVGAAFSMAAATLFVPLVLGVFWKRANQFGAIAGMVGGLGLTLYYMINTYDYFIQMFGIAKAMPLWFGIQPISSGIFGVALNLALMVVVSLVTPKPAASTVRIVEEQRYPHHNPDISKF